MHAMRKWHILECFGCQLECHLSDMLGRHLFIVRIHHMYCVSNRQIFRFSRSPKFVRMCRLSCWDVHAARSRLNHV